MTRSLGDLGERGIYRELLQPRYKHVESFGDDCAVVAGDLVVTTDSCPTPLMEQLTREADPYHEGWLLATINLSDLAAAGAKPLGLVVNYTLPASTEVTYFEQLVEGVDACAQEHGTRVVGGDVRDGDVRHLSATAIGKARKRLSRRGARAGDALLLIGDPGYLWAWAVATSDDGVNVLDRERELLRERARHPRAQLRAGRLLAKSGLATAAVDVSDGLYRSVRLLMEVNGVGAELDPEVELSPVPGKVCELAGIDPFALAEAWGDWCLLAAVRPDKVDEAERVLRAQGVRVREIGALVDTPTRLLVGDAEWEGLDQQRFTRCSWQGGGIHEVIKRMKKARRGRPFPGSRRPPHAS